MARDVHRDVVAKPRNGPHADRHQEEGLRSKVLNHHRAIRGRIRAADKRSIRSECDGVSFERHPCLR